MIQDRKRFRWLILAGICLLGAMLRLFHLSAQSLWLDEAFSAILAQRGWAGIVAGASQDITPPLYYLLLHSFVVTIPGEMGVRLWSAVLGILAIPLLYALGRQLFNEKVGLLGALLLAVNPFHIFYSQEARMYSQLAFFSLLAALCFWNAWQDGRAGHWLGFTLSMTAALYTHNIAFLLLGALIAFALLDWQRAGNRWKGLVVSLGAVGLLMFPWLLYLPGQVRRVGGGFWIETPSAVQVLTSLRLFLFGYALSPFWGGVALFVGLYATAITLLIAWRALRRQTGDREPLIFLLCLFGIVLIGAYLISLVYPIFSVRTLIISTTALYLLLAWGLTRIPRTGAFLFMGAILLLSGISLSNYYADPGYAKPPIREAGQYVREEFRSGDAILHTSDSSYTVFAYYMPDLNRYFPTGDPDYEAGTTRARAGLIMGVHPLPLPEIVAAHSRLWLIVTLDHNVEYQRTIVSYFDGCYTLLDHQEIGGIHVFLYDLSDGSGLCP